MHTQYLKDYAEEEQLARGAPVTFLQGFHWVHTALIRYRLVRLRHPTGQAKTSKCGKVGRAHHWDQPGLPPGRVHVPCQETSWENHSGDCSHTTHSLFRLLLSAKRHRLICTRTSRHWNSFSPAATTIINTPHKPQFLIFNIYTTPFIAQYHTHVQ